MLIPTHPRKPAPPARLLRLPPGGLLAVQAPREAGQIRAQLLAATAFVPPFSWSKPDDQIVVIYSHDINSCSWSD